MKKKIQLLAVLFVFVFTFMFSAAAVEYGYYDVNLDGSVNLADACIALKKCLSSGLEGGLLRVVKTLRIGANSEVVAFTVTEVDCDKKVATLRASDSSVTYAVPFSVLGLDRVENAEFFKGGTASLTVPTAADFDVSQIYAAKVESNYPTVMMSDAECAAGEEITLTVKATKNPGIVGAQFCVRYDANVMSYVSAKNGTGNFYFSASEVQGANPVKLVLANLNLKEVAGDFTVAEIKFAVNTNAKAGEYTVSLSSVEAYDGNIAPVVFYATNGSVTVK